MKATLPDLPEAVLEQAIDWMVRLHSGEQRPSQQAEFSRWLAANPLHALAWQALQRTEQRFQKLAPLPPQVALQTLESLGRQRLDRRQAIKLLSLFGAVGASGGLAWNQLPIADYRTATGERRSFELGDGSRLQLNTGSAVLERFDARQRLLELQRGEIHLDIRSGDPRPFWVHTRHTQLQALGARFSVCQDESHTDLQVDQGSVAIHRTASETRVATQGQNYRITPAQSLLVARPTRDGSAWTLGQLVARQLPLGELASELGRHRHGWLICAEAVADLRVSGVFQLADIDKALDALADSLPVRIERTTRLWTRIVPA